MTPYFIVLAFILCIWAVCGDKRPRFGLYLCTGTLVLFSGLRYEVGQDYLSYKDIFLMIDNGPNEAGFNFIIKTSNYIGLPYEFLFFLFALITILLASSYIRKNSHKVFLSVLIFFTVGQFYFNTFNALRQCVVVYIFYNIIKYIETRSLIKYTIGVALSAFFFHTTAVVLFPLYFIIHRKYNMSLYIAVIISIIAFSSVLLVLIENSPYAAYLEFEKFSKDASPVTYLLLIISVLIHLMYYKNVITTRQKILYNINVLSIATNVLSIMFAATPLIMVTNRFSYYFSPVLIVLLPNVICDKFRGISRSLIIFLLVISFTLMFMVTLYLNGESNNIVPYHTIFTKHLLNIY